LRDGRVQEDIFDGKAVDLGECGEVVPDSRGSAFAIGREVTEQMAALFVERLVKGSLEATTCMVDGA
jgi:hypothetical protein